MKKQHLKSLIGTITDYVVAKKLTSQIVGGITDPNDDNDPPEDPNGGDDLAGTNNDSRHNSTSQGTNASSRS